MGIGEQIAEERKRVGMTQEELADKVGTKKPNISRLESGKTNPTVAFLEKVARGLGKEIKIELK